jgi:Tripartite tricarboxylate transporter family receptor
MMRLAQSYHTRALPADSALWGRLRRKRRRSPGLPEVPTFQKAGIKGLVIEPWFGVFVPAGTPAAIVVRLNYPLSYSASVI